MAVFNQELVLMRYQRLLRYALPYWRGWVLITGLTLLSAAFGLLQPWPMKIVVDHVLGQKPMSGTLGRAVALLPGTAAPEGLLGWAVLASLGVFVLNSAAGVILPFAWVWVGRGMVYDLAQDLFAHIQRRSLLFHRRNAVGDLISRVTGDTWSLHVLVDALLLAPGRALITLAAMIVVMARMDVSLTLLALVVAPFMTGASFLLGRPIQNASRAHRKIESRIQSHVQRTLSGIPVVQAFTQEEREHRRFQEFAGTAIRTQQRSTLLGSFSNLASGLITTLGTGAILWIGARRVLQGQLTVGDLLVFLAYLGTLQEQMNVFTGIYTTLQGSSPSVDRVMEVLEVKREVEDRPGAWPLRRVQGHVRLERVSFGYEEGYPILREVSLEALPGQTIAIVGATGAGKSTLISLVPRFFDPWQGRVLIDGQDVRDVQLVSLRKQVALVLQEPFLFPLTIAENIAYGRPQASRHEIETAARMANAHTFITRLPAGYDTHVGERGATLSGGERQRLSIARALLKDAPILILDEPTSALDAETEAMLLEALERLMQGRTTFIIAHRLSTIRRADRIVAMQEGRIAEVGTHPELLARGSLYARLYHTQMGQPTAAVPSVGG
jgi:ATP-binding cassette subfamily B protein